MNYILRRKGLGRKSTVLIAQQSEAGLGVRRADQRLPNAGIVFRWGATHNIPNGTVVNSAEAIHRGSDKPGFRRLLKEKNLAPKTWFNALVSFPCVVRPPVHSQGRNLYVVKNSEELQVAIRACGGDFYATELVDKRAEFRVYVVSGRVIGVSEKFPNPERDRPVAWNLAQGGSTQNVKWDNWPLKVVKAALEAHKLSGLDFSAIDVIVDRQDNPLVLEINSAPTVYYYRALGFAKAFDYIISRGKQEIPLVSRTRDWKKFIHPALSDRALI